MIVDKSNQKITLIKKLIPFVANIDSTHAIKVNWYKQVVSDIEGNRFIVNYYPLKLSQGDSFLKKISHD